MHTDEENIKQFLEVLESPVIRELVLLAAVVGLLGLALISAGVML